MPENLIFISRFTKEKEYLFQVWVFYNIQVGHRTKNAVRCILLSTKRSVGLIKAPVPVHCGTTGPSQGLSSVTAEVWHKDEWRCCTFKIWLYEKWRKLSWIKTLGGIFKETTCKVPNVWLYSRVKQEKDGGPVSLLSQKRNTTAYLKLIRSKTTCLPAMVTEKAERSDHMREFHN